MTENNGGRVLKLAVIGAGTLGRTLALRAAQSGLQVILEDVLPAKLRRAQDAAQFLEAPGGGPLSIGQAGSGAHVELAGTVEDAVRTAELVIDCVPDELESKLEILCLIDRMAPPRCIILTPTVALSISDLSSCTYREDRCVSVAMTHEALEKSVVVPGTRIPVVYPSSASADTLARVSAVWQQLGLEPELVLETVAP